jgi:hypothetical protein
MLERLRDALRSAATARELTRGIKAYREGKLADARAAVDAVCASTAAPGTSKSQRMHQLSVRVIAVTLRAEVAAKQGDDAVARASIDEGFALWREAQGLGVKVGTRSEDAFADWERWAKGWLARGSGGA